MKIIKIIIMAVIIAVLQFPLICFANQHREKPLGYVIITGQFDLEVTSYHKPALSVYTGSDINIKNKEPENGIVYQINVKNKGFYIRVPVFTKFSYLKIKLLKSVNFLSHGLPLVSIGDSINLKIIGSEISISGSNHLSLNYQKKVYEEATFRSGGEWNHNYVQSLFSDCKSVIREANTALSIISVDDDLKKIMRINMESRYRMSLLNKIYPIAYQSDSDLKIDVGRKLEEYFHDWCQINDPIVLNNSQQYINCTLLYYHLKTAFYPDTSGNSFDKLYEEIITSTSGVLRDKLISYLFWKKSGLKGNFDKLLPIAMNSIADSSSKAVMQKIIAKKSKGTKAYDFRLTDANDKLISLSQFKGKLVVCHFWFTGCIACIQLAKNLKPIIAKLSGDTNVVFININVDKQKQRWLNSLNEGNYTSEHEISLFTEGSGINHPLIDYYSFVSFPKLMIIDAKGNLLSADFPQPKDLKSIKDFELFLKANK